MNYQIYTDGAHSQEKGIIAASCFITANDTTFVAQDYKKFKCNDIAVAEMIAIGLGAETLMSTVEITKKDTVTVYSDNQRVLQKLEPIHLGHMECPSKADATCATWSGLVRLRHQCRRLQLKKVTGHSVEFTGNTVADRLAKVQLRTTQCLQ